MTDFFNYIYDKVSNVIKDWNGDDIYAISFLVRPDSSDNEKKARYPELSIAYNTEELCDDKDVDSEERWNVAFWDMDYIMIISGEGESALFDEWYDKIGVANIGYENEDEMYDEDGTYIGKGPNGYYEFLTLVSNVACKLQTDGTIKNKFGNIPIMVHDFEYTWYTKDATINANPNGEAKDYLHAYEELFK